jgi:hypothetical protein
MLLIGIPAIECAVRKLHPNWVEQSSSTGAR